MNPVHNRSAARDLTYRLRSSAKRGDYTRSQNHVGTRSPPPKNELLPGSRRGSPAGRGRLSRVALGSSTLARINSGLERRWFGRRGELGLHKMSTGSDRERMGVTRADNQAMGSRGWETASDRPTASR